MILGIDPTVDYAFKHFLGREITRPILVNVIDSVLDPLPAHRIYNVDLMNPFNPKEAFDDKQSILDIKARDQSGRQFNVEMQMLAYRAYKKRVLYNLCKLHQQQLHEGNDYLVLKPSISITFLNDVLFPKVPDYHLHFRLLEQTHHFPLTEDMEFHILELPKFNKTPEELTTDLDVWLYFLRHAEKMDTDALPAALRRPLVQKAMEELAMLTQTDLERERYEARRKAQLDENTKIKERELMIEEGREEGRQEGRQIGLAQGEIIGTVHAFERLLQRPPTPTGDLTQRSVAELTRLAEELEAQVLTR